MHTTQLTNITSALLQKMLVALAVGAVALAFLAAGNAHADTKKGNGGSTGCQIENDGHVETVPVGTKVGLFTCGQDGEWHFGWLINAIKAPSKALSPSSSTPLHHGVMQVTNVRVAR
ncbi:MAG: hypothetical protein ACYDHT_11245 [Solirubrobacteraceae bacterium]